MSKISVLYMAVDYKDAHDFLIWLIDKTRSDIPIVRFDRKRYVLETDIAATLYLFATQEA